MAHKKTRNEQYAGRFSSGMEAFETLTDPRNERSKRHYFGEVLFIAHVTTLRPELAGELIAIDGKTVRHSFKDGDSYNNIHLISA
jgi:hypothetical protein